jgi:hypothetical protein
MEEGSENKRHGRNWTIEVKIDSVATVGRPAQLKTKTITK